MQGAGRVAARTLLCEQALRRLQSYLSRRRSKTHWRGNRLLAEDDRRRNAPSRYVRRQSTSESLSSYPEIKPGWLIDRFSNISPLLYARAHEERNLPLLYSSESSSDELPYWVSSPLVLDGQDKASNGMLVIPVTHDTGDFRFTSKGSGWASPKDFYEHLVRLRWALVAFVS